MCSGNCELECGSVHTCDKFWRFTLVTKTKFFAHLHKKSNGCRQFEHSIFFLTITSKIYHLVGWKTVNGKTNWRKNNKTFNDAITRGEIKKNTAYTFNKKIWSISTLFYTRQLKRLQWFELNGKLWRRTNIHSNMFSWTVTNENLHYNLKTPLQMQRNDGLTVIESSSRVVNMTVNVCVCVDVYIRTYLFKQSLLIPRA